MGQDRMPGSGDLFSPDGVGMLIRVFVASRRWPMPGLGYLRARDVGSDGDSWGSGWATGPGPVGDGPAGRAPGHVSGVAGRG